MQTQSTVRSVVIDPQGRMLIIRRSSTDPLHGGAWDLPGGQVETGETLEAALARETQEEIGLKLAHPKLLFATSDIRSGASKTWLFFVQEASEEIIVSLGDEHDEYKWINPAELIAYTDYDILLRLH